MPEHTHCRICLTRLPEPFLDLGAMPLANSFPASSEEFSGEALFPLAVAGCLGCGLVQLTHVVPKELLYRNYPYVSSTSESVRRYSLDLAACLIQAHRLGPSDLVVELGSNDGLVLKAFQDQGVRVLGIEPARNIAAVARGNGIPTVEEFFSLAFARRLAREAGKACLLLGRHVFAHIDDLHDLMEGARALLSEEGAFLIEVPYLGNLFSFLEFDTIYHEHLSYLSLAPLRKLCEPHGLELVDAQEVPLHGGSLLLTFQRQGKVSCSQRLGTMLQREKELRLTDPKTQRAFALRVFQWRPRFEGLIQRLAEEGARLVGYGAAAKANTLLNFCPQAARFLRCVLDRNPWKVGRYTPGTHLPIVDAGSFNGNGASHMVILAWNFKEEIMAQMGPFAQQGGRFVLPIPEPVVL